jgi:ATP-dependent Clp protease adapter protein ClpS
MANTQAMCSQFKVDLMNGLHAFGASVVRAATTKDAYKAALYLVSASRGAADTVYSATGEVSGTGYVAGGVAATTATAPSLSGTTAIFTPSASFVYTTVTLTTAFDAVLLYNDTSATKLAVSVHTFGSQTITAGTFTLTMPVNDASNALERIA